MFNKNKKLGCLGDNFHSHVNVHLHISGNCLLSTATEGNSQEINWPNELYWLDRFFLIVTHPVADNK